MTNELVVSSQPVVSAPAEIFLPKPELFLPVLNKQKRKERAEENQSIKNGLVEGVHYQPPGPGRAQSTLLKAGAEQYCGAYGCHVVPKLVLSIEDWTGDKYGKPNVFAYTYECLLLHGSVPIAQAAGHCNSRESRYAWR